MERKFSVQKSHGYKFSNHQQEQVLYILSVPQMLLVAYNYDSISFESFKNPGVQVVTIASIWMVYFLILKHALCVVGFSAAADTLVA